MSTVRGEIVITAETGQAQQGLEGLRGSTRGASEEIANLGKIAPGAGKNLNVIESAAGGVAQSLGVSSQSARVLTSSFKTLTGSISPMNLALGAGGVALTAISAAVMDAKRRHDEWIQSVIEGHRRVADYTAALADMSRRGFDAAIAGATEAEAAELRLARARTLAAEQSIGSIEDVNDAHQRAQAQFEALAAGEASLRAQLVALQNDGERANRREIAAIQRRIDVNAVAQQDTVELISLLGDLRRERDRNTESASKLAAEEEKLAAALRAQAIALSSAAKEEERRQRAREAAIARARELEERERALTAAFLDQVRGQQSAMTELEAIRVRFLSEEERRQELLRDLGVENFEAAVDLERELVAIRAQLASETNAFERRRLLERIENLYEYSEIQREIWAAEEAENQERLDILAQQELEHQTKLKMMAEDAAAAEAARIAERQQMWEDYMNSTLSMAQGMTNRLVGVYVQSTRKEARERRRALGSSMMAEGLSNIISAPIRALLMGPQAGVTSAGTGAAQLAFGKSLGGSLGASGGGGGGAPAVSAPQTQQIQNNVNETSTVNYNIGMVGDPREFSLRQRQADQRGQRIGQRGL